MNFNHRLFYQPFETFELYVSKLNFRTKLFNFFFLNSSITLCLLFLIILFLFFFVQYSSYILPSFIRFIMDNLLIFAVAQVKGQIGRKSMPWLSLFVFFFIFILFSNYFGLIPFSFTLTSHFNYVLIPTASIFIGITIRIFTDNLLNFLRHFVPAGIPLAIGIFSFFIEIISYFFRAISLPVRVFANMVAGHVLLFLMATALFINFEMFDSISLKLSLFFILFIWFAVFHSEILVAYLQAYVFLTMISIYAKDMGKKPIKRNMTRFKEKTKNSILFNIIAFYGRIRARLDPKYRWLHYEFPKYVFGTRV